MKEKNQRTEEKKKIKGSKAKISMKKSKKKNIKRLGGPGLSLEVFANAKSNPNNHYNPGLIKKQREFYKNAKYVSKFKKKMKQQSQQNDLSSTVGTLEDENETGEGSKIHNKNKNKKSYSLKELYEKKHEEEEKARVEREAVFKAKKEEREKAEARRKAAREKMFKKTRYGQPVMKYRIEHLLENIQGSN